MEQKQKNITVNGVEIVFPVWSMKKQLQKQSVIFPIVSRPLSNAVAMWDDGEDDEEEAQKYFFAGVIKGVMDALAEADMDVVAPQLLEGVAFRGPQGVLKPLTIKAIDAEEVDLNLGHLYTIFAAIVKVNYGPLLNSGLQESLKQIMTL